MAQWTILLCSLYGLLHGQDIRPLSLQQCCQDGKDRALGADCTVLPLISSSNTCRIVQEQCCAAAVRDRFCDNGIKMARGQRACEALFFQGDPWETKISKTCCDCCMLGLMTALKDPSCENQDLFLERQCANSVKTCCDKNTTEEIKPNEACNCSQLCVGNGTCACHNGYRLHKDGVNCEDVNECLTGSHNCILGQACINTVGSFRCQRETSCGTGYELKDDNSCQDIDECTLGTHNCGPDFLCTNTAGSFRCHPKERCADGFTRDAIGSCIDINECVVNTSPCLPSLTCVNTMGSYTCRRYTVTCGQGYRLTEDGAQCEDVDECRTGNVCGGHGCINLVGSYRCECRIGFIFNSITKLCEACSCSQLCVGNGTCACHNGYRLHKDGVNCEDINECVVNTSPCLPSLTCVNTMGSYTCRRYTVTCGRGYHLTEDGAHCEDVDECRTGNVCGGHGCINLVGSYRCECRIGFIFNSITKLCEDINECRHYPGRLCAHKCDNTEGSYQCSCTTGFKLSHDGRNCEDVNECEANPCSQECANVYGSYQCYCRRGYQLSDMDGITCEDIDECDLPTGGHVCSYSCSNVPGSFYCTCPRTGYTLSQNGRTCQDIDECAAGIHTCSVTESCFNVQGGFRCLSFTCPPNFKKAAQGSRRDASVNVRCIKACQPKDIGCNLDPVHLITHTALPLPTFRDISEPEDLVFLRTVAAANPVPGATDVFFDILNADDKSSFDVQKRSHQGMIMGVVRQVKPIIGPKDLVLEVAMNYVKSGIISHRNIVIIHFFVSEFWF